MKKSELVNELFRLIDDENMSFGQAGVQLGISKAKAYRYYRKYKDRENDINLETEVVVPAGSDQEPEQALQLYDDAYELQVKKDADKILQEVLVILTKMNRVHEETKIGKKCKIEYQYSIDGAYDIYKQMKEELLLRDIGYIERFVKEPSVFRDFIRKYLFVALSKEHFWCQKFNRVTVYQPYSCSKGDCSRNDQQHWHSVWQDSVKSVSFHISECEIVFSVVRYVTYIDKYNVAAYQPVIEKRSFILDEIDCDETVKRNDETINNETLPEVKENNL